MAEIVVLDGPLEPERLRWVADLYGQVDTRYRDRDYLEHLFVRAPAGPAVHAFGLDGTRPVAHYCVVPMRGRRGAAELRCGKPEALVVEEAHRGRVPGEEPLVLRLRRGLYDRAAERGIAPLHAYVRPGLGRVIGLERLEVGARTLVAVVSPRSAGSAPARATASALFLAQGALRSLAGRRRDAKVRAPTAADVDLVRAPLPPEGAWTVLGEDSWDWYRGFAHIRVLETRDARALVQLPGSPGGAVRVVGWRADRAALGPAVRVLAAAARLARASGAATVRYQPWEAPSGDGALRRAARALGCFGRDDFTSLYVSELSPVVPTPLLYLGF